jgi:hypothetical protein
MDGFKYKLASAAIVLVAAALPATATASRTTTTRSFSGTVQAPPNPGENTIEFKAKVVTIKKPHHPKRVKVTKIKSPLEFGDLPLLCQTGPNVLLTLRIHHAVSVRNNQVDVGFARSPDTHTKVNRFKAEFTNRARKASGTIRASGYDDTDQGGTSSGCDSFTLHWTAHT